MNDSKGFHTMADEKNPDTPAKKDTGGGAVDAFKNGVAVWVAVLAVVALGVTAIWMFRHLGNTNWDRSVYVFGAIEALAFSGAGFLWGKEVHREAAQTAKDDAKDAKDDAKATKADAKADVKAAQNKAEQLMEAAAGGRTPWWCPHSGRWRGRHAAAPQCPKGFAGAA